VSDWGEWGLCSQSCGGGLSGRKKDVLVEPKYNGAECPEDLRETKYCINKDCPEEGPLKPEVLWGSREEEKFAAQNVLIDEPEFSNSTHANYWRAQKGQTEEQGFVVRVGNSKRKIVGVEIRNTKKGLSQTVQFQLEGSLLKEPEQVGLRRALAWTPEVLKAAGDWEVLLSQQTLKEQSLSQENPPMESIFFDVPTELRYLWFHLLSFHGQGGGLRYFAPILQSDVCTWTNWTSCDWFCDEQDPGNKTRSLRQKENGYSQDLSHLCDGDEALGCYENCTEPFELGPWEDTDECTESCKLRQQRTCKEINPRASCQDAPVERVGETDCNELPCPKPTEIITDATEGNTDGSTTDTTTPNILVGGPPLIEGSCVDMVGQGILMPIHDIIGGSSCGAEKKCRPMECCSQGENEQRFRKAHGISNEDAKGTCRVKDSVLYAAIGITIFILFAFTLCACCVCYRRRSQRLALQRRKPEDDVPVTELPPVPQ